MQLCDWEETGEHLYRCRVCGRQAYPIYKLPYYVPCGVWDWQPTPFAPPPPPKPIPPKPSAVKRAVNFAGALKRRARAEATGQEAGLRTAAEIREIFQTHCAQCPGGYFDGEICRHQACGCNVTEDPTAKLNKLAWRSESCPLGLWGPAAQPEGNAGPVGEGAG